MKRIVCIAVVLALVLPLSFFLVGCKETPSAYDGLRRFCKAVGLESAVYSSEAAEWEEGYIGGELLSLLYYEELPRDVEFALVLHAKLESFCEVGVFISESAYARLHLSDILSERIEFLGSMGIPGEGFVRKFGRVTVYGYLPEAERGISAFEKIYG